MKVFHGFALFGTLLLTTACGQETPDADASLVTEAGLVVHEARAHLLPGGLGALYFTVKSGDATSDRLLRVETSAATAAEIHETLNEDGVMRMVAHPDGFEVPAGGELVFGPGGKHVMLLGFQTDVGAKSIELTLHFEHAGTVKVDAKVLTMATS